MAFIDYYKILQVDRNASDKIIQAAFRAFAKQYHPDTNPNDPTAEEKFKAVNEAYEALGDPVKREEYNKMYDEHYAPPRRAYQQQSAPPGAAYRQQQHASPPPNPLVCPHCGRADHVQQVSSLVTSQTWSGSSMSYGFVGEMQTQLSGFSQGQTLLSRRLSPPNAPRYQNPWLWMILYLIPGVPFILCAAVPTVFDSSSSNPLMVAIGIGVILAVWCSREVPRRQAKYNAEFLLYNKAMARWHQLYYCHRDDGVFIPGQGTRFIPADSMMDFLYEP